MAKKTFTDTKSLVIAAVCVALIVVCSWITVPSVVPFTLQTFAVFCVLECIGAKYGTLSVTGYILLAALGLPVLSGFRGGIGALLGTTGGYVLGFLLMGLTYGLGTKLFGKKLWVRVACMVVGLLLCYAFGTAWFMTVYARQTGAIGLSTALSWCVFPFIVPDLVKLALAVMLAGRVRKILKLS